MNKPGEPFHVYGVEKWEELQKVYKADWPRGITGYYALDSLSKCLALGLDYGFKMLVPFGAPENGMVVIIKDEISPEANFIEMLIECPQDDTSKLEEALQRTKLLDWTRDIVILFPPEHVYKCMKKIEGDNIKIDWVHEVDEYILEKNTPLLDVSLPPGFTFKVLTEEFVDVINSKWPHRSPGSTKYFSLLIRSGSGYGLFKEEELVAWGFVKETGALGHLFTLEQHRRKGYGELTTKIICNERLKEGKDVFSFLVDGNLQSSKMHEKIGFVKVAGVYTIGLRNTK